MNRLNRTIVGLKYATENAFGGVEDQFESNYSRIEILHDRKTI